MAVTNTRHDIGSCVGRGAAWIDISRPQQGRLVPADKALWCHQAGFHMISVDKPSWAMFDKTGLLLGLDDASLMSGFEAV